MKKILFLLLFAANMATAQTYTPLNGKVVITITQETQDGGEITTRSGEIDSLEAANRFFNTLIATNQRIAELRAEVDDLERQANRASKAFKDLGGKDTDQKIADIYGAALIGNYTITDTTSVKDAEIKLNASGKLILRVGTTNYALKVLSNQYFTVAATLLGGTAPVEFIQRNAGIYIYSERGKKITLKKKA